MAAFTYPYSAPSAQEYPVPSQVSGSVPVAGWDPSPAMERLAVNEMPTMPQIQTSMEQPGSHYNGQTRMAYPVIGSHYQQVQPIAMPFPAAEPSPGYGPYVQHVSTQYSMMGNVSGYNPQAQHTGTQHMGTQHDVMGPPVQYYAQSQYSATQHPPMATFSGFSFPAQQMNVQPPVSQTLPVNQYHPIETHWVPSQQQSSVAYQPMPYYPTGMPPSMLQQEVTAHQPPTHLPFFPPAILTPSHHNVSMGPRHAPALEAAAPAKRKRGRPSNAEKARAAALHRQELEMAVADAGPSLAAPPKALATPEASPAPDPGTLAPASGLPTLVITAPTTPPSIPAAVSVPTQDTFTFTAQLPLTPGRSPSAPIDATPKRILTTIDPNELTTTDSAPESSIPPIPTLATLVADSANVSAQGQAEAQGSPVPISGLSVAWRSEPSRADSELFKSQMITLRRREFEMATARKRRALAQERDMAEVWDQEARRKQASMEFHQLLGYKECSELWADSNTAM